MENSPFNKISAELRNRIWDLTVTTSTPGKPLIVGTCSATPPAITLTCKQIRNESRLTFYADNDFEVLIDATPERVLKEGLTRHSYEASCSLKIAKRWMQTLKQPTHDVVRRLIISFTAPTYCSDKLRQLADRDEWRRLTNLLEKNRYDKPRLKLQVPVPQQANDNSLYSHHFNRVQAQEPCERLRTCYLHAELVVMQTRPRT